MKILELVFLLRDERESSKEGKGILASDTSWSSGYMI